LKKFFATSEDRQKLAFEYLDFSSKLKSFCSFDTIEDQWILDPKSWWVMHDYFDPLLQKLTLKILMRPCSSSCCERNWSSHSSIHLLKNNKLDLKRA